MTEELTDKLSRWSQRKLAARRGIAAADEADTAMQGVEPPAPAKPADDDETLASRGESADACAARTTDDALAKLPSIDELTADSDYTVFFGKNVPEALKNAALRKLWRSDPIFGQIDGLDNYAEDYNVIDRPITLAETSYKVGKGFLDDVAENFAGSEPARSEKIPRPRESDAVSSSDERETGDTLSQNVAAEDRSAITSPQAGADEPSGPVGGPATHEPD